MIYLQGCDLMQFLCNFNCKLSTADKCTTLEVIADLQPGRLPQQTDESLILLERAEFLGSLEFSDE